MNTLHRMWKSSLFSGIIFIALGIVLFIWPGLSLQIFTRAVGIFLTLYGLIRIIGNFIRKESDDESAIDLTAGSALLIAGIFAIIKPEPLIDFIPMLLGLSFVLVGIHNISQAVINSRYGLSVWWIYLLFALINLSVGLFLLLNPTQSAIVLFRIAAAMMIYNGLTLICMMIVMKRLARNAKHIVTIASETKAAQAREESSAAGEADGEEKPSEDKADEKRSAEDPSAEDQSAEE